MKRNLIHLITLFVIVAFSACSNSTQTSMMRNVTGKAGELVVVISPEKWESESGQALRSILAQPQVGLPQDEPLFKVINIPLEAYGEIFKTSRNIVQTQINAKVEKPEISFQKNANAYTQALVNIVAKNEKQFVELVNENSDKIMGFFLKAERDRLLMNYSKYNDKGVMNQVEKEFGINITVPPGFKVEEQTDDFMWIRYETPEISQGILIYTYPYESDSTFTSDFLVTKRNIVLKNNVPGPTDGSYMTTENQVPIFFNVLKKDGNYAAELRGVWKVANDFMGGPFISLSILDLLNNRVVTLDAYVYAPSTDKRNFLRQVEAMIYSAKFPNQEDMNKLNKQFE